MTSSASALFERFPLFAHRGFRQRVRPENSLSAFDEAARLGYGIELDVRLTSDGVLVVFHDKSLKRMTGVASKVSSMPYRDLPMLRGCQGPQRIPTLRTTLDLVAGRVPILVEVKNKGVPGPLEESVAAHLSAYDGDATAQSFNLLTVRWFAQQAPEIIRGVIAGAYWEPHHRLSAEALAAADPDYLVWDARDLNSGHASLLASQAGIPLVPGPVRRAADLAAADRAGAAATIHDAPLPQATSKDILRCS